MEKRYITDIAEQNKILKRAGENLRSVRKRCGLTPKQVGDQIGVSGNMIEKYESGMTDIPSTKLLALSRLFHVPMGAFVTDQMTPEETKMHVYLNAAVQAIGEEIRRKTRDITLNRDVYDQQAARALLSIDRLVAEEMKDIIDLIEQRAMKYSGYTKESEGNQ